MRVALCYDRVSKLGGAERVLKVLHELWPEAPVYTLTYSAEGAQWAKGWDIRTSFLQKLPIIGKKHELFPPLAALAWEDLRFGDFDVVISVTSSEAKSILVPPKTLHICYCLTPTRYYWSGYLSYLARPGFGWFDWLVRLIFPFLAYLLRVQDFIHAQRPELMVGISDTVCRRIQKYYRRDSLKLYPPVSVAESVGFSSAKKYFLVVSRLVPYKRVDLVVEAFTKLGWPLVVVGTGSEERSLRNMAGSTIQFKGFVEDSALPALYAEAIALIFPTEEDFGIVPVEAQSYGVPVVAYGVGGAMETVVPGETGLFFYSQTADSLIDCLQKQAKNSDFLQAFVSLSGEACRQQARKFATDQFKSQFTALVEKRYAEYVKQRSKVV